MTSYQNRTVGPRYLETREQWEAMTYVPEDSDLPDLYTTENTSDPQVKVKLFTPDSNWTWYLTEFDGQRTAFGLVAGFETELGYVDLDELAAARGPMGLPVERDIYFRPTLLSVIRQYEEERR